MRASPAATPGARPPVAPQVPGAQPPRALPQALAAGRYEARLWSNALAPVLAAIADAHGAVPAWLCRESGPGARDDVVIAIGLPAWAVGGRAVIVANGGQACLVGQVARRDVGCARLAAALAYAAAPLAAGLWRGDDGAWHVTVPDPLDLPY